MYVRSPTARGRPGSTDTPPASTRAYPPEGDTYILDFVNEPDASPKGAQDTTARRLSWRASLIPTLSSTSKPSWMPRATMTTTRWTAVSIVEMDLGATQGQLDAARLPVADRLARSFRTLQADRRRGPCPGDARAGAGRQRRPGGSAALQDRHSYHLRVSRLPSPRCSTTAPPPSRSAIFFQAATALLDFGFANRKAAWTSAWSSFQDLPARLEGSGQEDVGSRRRERRAARLPHERSRSRKVVQEKERVLLNEIIQKVNDCCANRQRTAPRTRRLVYVNNVTERPVLSLTSPAEQAPAATQPSSMFADSPDFDFPVISHRSRPIMDALRCAATATSPKQSA